MENKQDRLNEVCNIIKQYNKTKELIKLLSMENIDWSQPSIDFAIKKTKSDRFSIDDINYYRYVNFTNQEISNSIKLVDKAMEKMANIKDKEERQKYYETTYQRILKTRNFNLNQARKQFSNLVFYAREV